MFRELITSIHGEWDRVHHTTRAWKDDAGMGYIGEILGDVWKVENGRESECMQ